MARADSEPARVARTCRAQPGPVHVSPRLDGPYEQTLPAVETERLYLTSLVPPLVAAGAASISDNCVADQAKRRVEVLLDAHVRATDHWASEGYENRHSRDSARVIDACTEDKAEDKGDLPADQGTSVPPAKPMCPVRLTAPPRH
jgi:hypothetical protein